MNPTVALILTALVLILYVEPNQTETYAITDASHFADHNILPHSNRQLLDDAEEGDVDSTDTDYFIDDDDVEEANSSEDNESAEEADFSEDTGSDSNGDSTEESSEISSIEAALSKLSSDINADINAATTKSASDSMIQVLLASIWCLLLLIILLNGVFFYFMYKKTRGSLGSGIKYRIKIDECKHKKRDEWSLSDVV